MPVRQTIIRASALAVLAGAGLAAAVNSGLIGGAGATPPAAQPQVAPPPMPAVAAATPPAAPVPAAMPVAVPVPVPVPVPAPIPVSATLPAPVTNAAPAVPVSALGLPCGLSVTGTAMPGAMVALDIFDPCRPDLRVEVDHAGLTVAAATDAMGLLTLDIPALETPAFFTVRLADGTETLALTPVPDLAGFGRVAVAWSGNAALELHAFERGADFGAAGHVWQDAPGSVTLAVSGAGGVLTRLGDPAIDTPRLAQVYTYPLALAGDLSLSVDIPVTAEGCGQPLAATSLQTAGDRIETQAITLTLPGCDAVGDYLVLQNLFETPRLAAN